jgi:hypothetical protein
MQTRNLIATSSKKMRLNLHVEKDWTGTYIFPPLSRSVALVIVHSVGWQDGNGAGGGGAGGGGCGDECTRLYSGKILNPSPVNGVASEIFIPPLLVLYVADVKKFTHSSPTGNLGK